MIHDNKTIKLMPPSIEDFINIRQKVGWGEIEKDLASRSLINSLFHVTIYHEYHLIGMGRVVGDGAMYFYIQDVIVDPNHQNQGVGKILMGQIEKYLQEAAGKGATIGLLSAKGKEDFYSQYGYIQRPNATLGNGMCKFI